MRHHVLITATALLLASCASRCGDTPRRPKARVVPRDQITDDMKAPDEPVRTVDDRPLILLIVMDTVRADHMSLCGYERPTTPFLAKLASEQANVSYTCDGVAPGTWTVPSHTSFFTGLDVPDHGNDSMGLRFGEAIPTLAEILSERGYKTMLMSANPTLSASSGLQRGFDLIGVAETLDRWRGPKVPSTLEVALRRVKPDQPLFLVVNLIDAHDPYPEIPPEVDWLVPRKQLPLYVHDTEQNQRYHRYLRGELSPVQARAYEEAIRDGYDYGISQADLNIERIFTVLRRNGRLKDGFRAVITSDHGEFLGEHGLLRHGCYTYEPVTRVPVLFFDPGLDAPVPLPSPLSGTQVFHLLRDGALAPDMAPTSTSKAREEDPRGCADMAALKTSTDRKLVWREGTFTELDLAPDPGEPAPQPLADDAPGADALRTLAERHQAHLEQVRATEADPDRKRELEALGYLE